MTKGRRAADRRRERERARAAGDVADGSEPRGLTSPDGAPALDDDDVDAPPPGRINEGHAFVEHASDEGLPEVSAVEVSPDRASPPTQDEDVDPNAMTRSRLGLAAAGEVQRGATKPGRQRGSGGGRARVEENPDAEAAFAAELQGRADADPFTDEVTVERELPERPRRRGGRFVVLAGPDAGQKIGLKETPLLLGRTARSDVRLTDPAVSLRHAELAWDEEDGWRLLDLGSTSGTLVNGRPALDVVVLKHGDVVAVGRSELRFLRAADPPSEKPLHEPTQQKEPTALADPTKVDEATGRQPREPTEVRPPPPATGKRARPVVVGLFAALVMVVVGSAVGIGYSLGFKEANPEQIKLQVASLLDEAERLLKGKDVDGARARLQTVLALDEKNPSAHSLMRMVDTETASREALTKARRFADEDRAEEAHAQLKRIPDASVFAPERDEVRAKLRARAVERSRKRVQSLIQSGRLDEALLFLRNHLEIWPDDADAAALEETITAERTKAPPPEPTLARARSAFASGDPDAARVAASEGAQRGVSGARSYLEDLERFEALVQEGDRAMQRKDGRGAVGPYDDAWRLLQRLGASTDGALARSMKKGYGDALYLAGVAELDGGDACEGARRILLAAKLAPEDPKVKAKLREVVSTAEQGLVRARAARTGDPARAKAIAREALCGAPVGSSTYKELRDLLR